jgi:DNA-binding MarR family transcriptional regulator
VSNARTSASIVRASTLAAGIRTTYRALKIRLREQGGRMDLAPSRMAVVIRLDRDGPATVSGLARAERMRPQSMRAVVAPLQEAGLVRGAPDPSDRRQTLMFLTPKCVRWLASGRSARQDWLTTTILQKLSASEQGKLAHALELLRRLGED